MKLSKWTVGLVAAGVVSSVVADEHPVNTALSSTTLSGYVDTAAIWNLGSGSYVAKRFVNTGPDRQDGFNLNAVKVALEKPLDENTWSAGYKAELFFGPDAAGVPGASDHNLKQAYAALRVPVGNGIDFKVGRYDAIIGYEVVDGYANPHFSRSFGLNIEPFIHTGVLASYQFSDIFGVAGGVANTDQEIIPGVQRYESRKTYMGSMTLKAPESWGWLQGSSLYGGIVDTAARAGGRDALNLYGGLTVPTPIEGFTLGAAYDYLGGAGWANAVAGYLSYQLTEQIKLNFRGEYAWSGWNPWTMGTYSKGDRLTGLTFTVDYQLWANVITRAEFRWDHSANGNRPFGRAFGSAGGAGGFVDDGGIDLGGTGGTGGVGGAGGGTQKNDLSLALNVIYKF